MILEICNPTCNQALLTCTLLLVFVGDTFRCRVPNSQLILMGGSRGLMDSESDLKAEGCGFESQVRQGLLVGGVSSFNTTTEVSLSKAPNPQLLPGLCNMAAHCSGCVFT